MQWETVIGLEIHAQLATRSKIFSGASTAYGAEPNTQACLVSLGMPGVLPVLNAEAVRMAIMFGTAIDAGRTAICPGSYDPVTNGHLDIIGRAARIFPRVIVGVVNQPLRKGQPLFTAEERKGFIERVTGQHGNVEVETFSTLLVDFARENGATAIVKGLRAISDFEYEFEMNQLNRKLAPEIESVYVMASPEYSFLSSTGVKELATFGGDVKDLVPGEVAEQLAQRIERR